MPTAYLGEFEQQLLLVILRLGAGAYGVEIARELEQQTGRRVSRGALYATLDRLERKGLVRSWVGEPTAQRGGRRRKYYALRPAGAAALRQAYHAFTAMASGLEKRLEAK